MISNMKRIIMIVSVLATLFAPSLVAMPALAANTPKDNICEGIGLSTNSSNCGDNGAQFMTILTNLINLLIIVVGIVAVVMIIISGFNFITSGGDSGKVTTAKNTLMYAIIGLLVVAFAEVIVHFVIGTARA